MCVLLVFVTTLANYSSGIGSRFTLPRAGPRRPMRGMRKFALSLKDSYATPVLFGSLSSTALLRITGLASRPRLARKSAVGLRIRISGSRAFARTIPLPYDIGGKATSIATKRLRRIMGRVCNGTPCTQAVCAHTAVCVMDRASTVTLPRGVALKGVRTAPRTLFVSATCCLVKSMGG